jgi:nucleoside-diphosphate-sugar epimerase
MNILITGSSGFLSKEFYDYFKNVNVFNIHRTELLDKNAVRKFILKNKIDFILHTSWAGVGTSTDDDLCFNISVHDNIQAQSDLVNKIFIFGSGAETFTDLSSNYCKGKLYAFNKSKKVDNMINFRIFGCFGKHENPSRFIKNSVNRIKNDQAILINKDKFMDFFFVEDLCKVIDFYMLSTLSLPKNLDCVYKKKYKLSEIASYINSLFCCEKPIEFLFDKHYDLDNPYMGCGDILEKLKIPLVGLKQGIHDIYGQEAANFRSRN